MLLLRQPQLLRPPLTASSMPLEQGPRLPENCPSPPWPQLQPMQSLCSDIHIAVSTPIFIRPLGGGTATTTRVQNFSEISRILVVAKRKIQNFNMLINVLYNSRLILLLLMLHILLFNRCSIINQVNICYISKFI
jgi:hypothetical protein